METEVLRVPAGLLQKMYDVIAAARHPNVEYGVVRELEAQLGRVAPFTPDQVAKLCEIEAAEADAARAAARITDVLNPEKHDQK